MPAKEYHKPVITVWDDEALSGIKARMDYGSPVNPTPPSPSHIYKYVYILFAPIEIEGFKLGFDHAAFFVEKTNGDGYFYSFATDPDMGLSLVTGCDGRLSTAMDDNCSPTAIPIEAITDDGTIWFTDQMDLDASPPVKYDKDDGYYQFIRVQLNGFAHGDDAALAVRERAGDIRLHNLDAPRQYSLLWNNCCDCALDCFAYSDFYPIQIEYDNTASVVFASSVITAMIDSENMLLGALGAALQTSMLLGGVPTIPNVVFDAFQRATVSGSLAPSYRHTFKSR